MKKQFFLSAFILVLLTRLNAQNVTIASVHTLPVVLTDTQYVQAVVSTVFSSGDCILLNSNYYVLNDTVHLTLFYEVGFLTVICYSTDTLDLGILPCTTHALHVQASISVGGSASDYSYQSTSIQCAATGISIQDDENGVSIFPNPAAEKMFVRIKEDKIKLTRISIGNVEGEILFSYDFKQFNNEPLIQLYVGTLSKGIYFLRLEIGKRVIMKRFVKI